MSLPSAPPDPHMPEYVDVSGLLHQLLTFTLTLGFDSSKPKTFEGIGLVTPESSLRELDGSPPRIWDIATGRGVLFTTSIPFIRASKEEAKNYLNNEAEKFNDVIRKGGLIGAIAARKQQNLQRIARLVINLHEMPVYGDKNYLELPNLHEAITHPLPTGTGIYVVFSGYDAFYTPNGIDLDYCSRKPMESLRFSPIVSLEEVAVESILEQTHPTGIGKITKMIRGSPEGYTVYEVPKEAMHMVENPLELRLQLSQ